MALQSSGAISITDIRTELGSSSYSLRTLSAAAGFSTPDAMSEFYGYSGVTAPSVTTNAASSVGVSTVTLNGNVTSDGGGTVTARGFYFGTNSNVTSNPTYGSGSGTGAFSLARTGLSSSTTYYFAAYATNSGGTAVGSTLSFTTQTPVTLSNRGTQFTVYHDGPTSWNGIYNFGSQCYTSPPFTAGMIQGYFSTTAYHQYNHPNYGWTTQWSTFNRLGTDCGNSINSGAATQSASLYHQGASGYTVQNRFYVAGQSKQYVTGANSIYGTFCRVRASNSGIFASYNTAMSADAVRTYSAYNTTAVGGTMEGTWNGSPSYLGARELAYWSPAFSSSSYFYIYRTSWSQWLLSVT